ncbi:MAG: sigma-70 family RNA polymerase sigma factor [Actinobacteria bacterium]|nr:sigma-70 family RNA polymerase sigma factor [Actinomycetota bacterium]
MLRMDGGGREAAAREADRRHLWDVAIAEREGLVRFAAHALIDRSAAEDAVHDVLAAIVIAGIPIARDELPGTLRRRVRWRVGELNRALRRVTPVDPVVLADVLEYDDQNERMRDEYAALADVFIRLDERARTAINLRYGSGMTHAAIAAAQGGSATESARATARARSIMRRLFEQRERGRFCDEALAWAGREIGDEVARRIAWHVGSCLYCSRVVRADDARDNGGARQPLRRA